MDGKLYKEWTKFDYHGINVRAYTNENNEIKKMVVAPIEILYSGKSKYYEGIYYKKEKTIIEPNGIAIDTSKISTIDVDQPDKCTILDKLIKDCKFYVKTKKGYHFYFLNNEKIIKRDACCGIADINLKNLWFVPSYRHIDTNEEFKYELVRHEKLVEVPEYAVD